MFIFGGAWQQVSVESAKDIASSTALLNHQNALLASAKILRLGALSSLLILALEPLAVCTAIDTHDAEGTSNNVTKSHREEILQ